MYKSFQPSISITKFTGSIERVLFHNDVTAFSILVVSAPQFAEAVTVKGDLPGAKVGETITCCGAWKEDPQRGWQFVAREIAYSVPQTLAGIEKYLASGLVDGIGPYFAALIVQRFGTDIFRVMEEEPHLLYDIPGLGDQRVEALVEGWREQREIRALMVFLEEHGVASSKALRIHRQYGDRAIAVLRENPYRLAEEMFGIGFKTADQLALHLGFDKMSPLRILSGLRYALGVLVQRGDCAIEKGRLIAAAAKLLVVHASAVEENLAALAGTEVVVERVDGQEYFYLATIHRAETGIVENLHRILSGPAAHCFTNPLPVVQQAEQKVAIILSRTQREAIELALANKVVIITGGPGVGKTTIIDIILGCMEKEGLAITLCAPTGKAAKRITETTGREAKTIHRTLDYDGKTQQFRINAANPLATDVVIVDEASMMDVVLMDTLLDAVPAHARLIIVGDRDQLASVGPGAVLGDFIKSGVIPAVNLTEIYRQAQGSKIITNAHRVNSGLLPEKHDGGGLVDFYFIATTGTKAIREKLDELVFKRIPERFGFAPEQIQVLTPTNKGKLGTRTLNREFQARFNPHPVAAVTRCGFTFAVGDKVMQVVNNYEKEVFNGETGIIAAIGLEAGVASVDFDGSIIEYGFDELDELYPAYVMTVHKSQGSEYPVVVIPVAEEHGIMLERNLLYTGMTRGKQLVIILGEPRAVQKAVTTVRAQGRATLLAQRLGTELAIHGTAMKPANVVGA